MSSSGLIAAVAAVVLTAIGAFVGIFIGLEAWKKRCAEGHAPPQTAILAASPLTQILVAAIFAVIFLVKLKAHALPESMALTLGLAFGVVAGTLSAVQGKIIAGSYARFENGVPDKRFILCLAASAIMEIVPIVGLVALLLIR